MATNTELMKLAEVIREAIRTGVYTQNDNKMFKASCFMCTAVSILDNDAYPVMLRTMARVLGGEYTLFKFLERNGFTSLEYNNGYSDKTFWVMVAYWFAFANQLSAGSSTTYAHNEAVQQARNEYHRQYVEVQK